MVSCVELIQVFEISKLRSVSIYYNMTCIYLTFCLLSDMLSFPILDIDLS